jgi:hypothetical protein
LPDRATSVAAGVGMGHGHVAADRTGNVLTGEITTVLMSINMPAPHFP